MEYPDPSKDRKGFNPIIYPDLNLKYEVVVQPLEGSSFKVMVNFDDPIPANWEGKIGFNLELFPGELFGKSYQMDKKFGIFNRQPNGPIEKINGEFINRAMAKGNTLVIAAEDDLRRITIQSKTNDLELWDGRSNHNNGWFIVRSAVPSGKTEGAIEWIITPNVVKDWEYSPVIQVSQIGYHSNQKKLAIIEQDPNTSIHETIRLYLITQNGRELVLEKPLEDWGKFLRYNYRTFDFTDIKEEGIYVLTYRDKESHPFKIAADIYDRDVWQPTLEYFLPVQMCHMRINEKYRVWHDTCHLDDALMAPTDTIHFDGYRQGNSTLTKYQPLEPVPGLNKGGWHDAGDYDLRVESQIGTIWKLALMIEEFGIDYDATLIDQENRLVEIHEKDGKSDAIQQIEHGLYSVLGGYNNLGRLYRGIICPTIRQYVMLGDAAAMTDNEIYVGNGTSNSNRSGKKLDDRFVFTEENPGRQLYVAAGLAAASRVLKNDNPELSNNCLTIAIKLWDESKDAKGNLTNKVLALSELILATKNEAYENILVSMKTEIAEKIADCGWVLGRVIKDIKDEDFKTAVNKAVNEYQVNLRKQQKEDSPFGVPYKPNIWGAGWTIQEFGVEQYFYYKGWPEFTSPDFFINAFNFVVGVHPGINTASFASGVGSNSVTTAYGVNRTDWSYIPGGVASGTALIRPNLPELKEWPFFWQQTEYVMGGGATNFMFLGLAMQDYFSSSK